MKNLSYFLIVAGAGLNIMDAVTSEKPVAGAVDAPLGGYARGVVYGPNGFLKALNDASPINIGLALIILGGGILAYRWLR